MIHRSLLSSFVEFHSTESSSSPRKKKQNKQNKRIQPERPSPFSGFVNSKERRNETKKKGEENNKKGKGSNWTLCRSFRSDGAAAAVSDVWRRTATRMGADVKTEETGSRRERMYVKDRERQRERERERDSQQPPSVRRRHAPAADSFGSGARRGRKDKKKTKNNQSQKKRRNGEFCASADDETTASTRATSFVSAVLRRPVAVCYANIPVRNQCLVPSTGNDIVALVFFSYCANKPPTTICPHPKATKELQETEVFFQFFLFLRAPHGDRFLGGGGGHRFCLFFLGGNFGWCFFFSTVFQCPDRDHRAAAAAADQYSTPPRPSDLL